MKKKKLLMTMVLIMILAVSLVNGLGMKRVEARQTANVLYYYEKGWYRSAWSIKHYTQKKRYKTIYFNRGAAYTEKKRMIFAYSSSACYSYTRTWRTY
ncbi:hypothetical protein [Listeria aquatica]|uniref:hypothetical protein n=1 Tax=Listeria aquatica TaxID=1494960 RepID=UPI0031F58269